MFFILLMTMKTVIFCLDKIYLKNSVFIQIPLIEFKIGTGELYMRCGTAIFSVCAMIDRCLSLIQMFEVYTNDHDVLQSCKITFTITMVANVLSLAFIFLQSFFIFKYANIIINYGKNMSIIGLIHVACTNFCVSFRTVVHETVSEIRHHQQKEEMRHFKQIYNRKTSTFLKFRFEK